MRKIIISTLAAMIAVPAAAATVPADNTVAVATADLDLTSQEGMDRLESRIEAAAEAVCERPFIRDLRAMQSWTECVAEARETAMAEVAFANPFEGVALASLF